MNALSKLNSDLPLSYMTNIEKGNQLMTQFLKLWSRLSIIPNTLHPYRSISWEVTSYLSKSKRTLTLAPSGLYIPRGQAVQFLNVIWYSSPVEQFSAIQQTWHFNTQWKSMQTMGCEQRKTSKVIEILFSSVRNISVYIICSPPPLVSWACKHSMFSFLNICKDLNAVI